MDFQFTAGLPGLSPGRCSMMLQRYTLGLLVLLLYILGHFQVGSYRIEGLYIIYTLQKPYRSPIYPKLPTCGFLNILLLFKLPVMNLHRFLIELLQIPCSNPVVLHPTPLNLQLLNPLTSNSQTLIGILLPWSYKANVRPSAHRNPQSCQNP